MDGALEVVDCQSEFLGCHVSVVRSGVVLFAGLRAYVRLVIFEACASPGPGSGRGVKVVWRVHRCRSLGVPWGKG